MSNYEVSVALHRGKLVEPKARNQVAISSSLGFWLLSKGSKETQCSA